MKITSSFKHLEHTPALDEKIQEKSQRLQKYFEGNFEIQWICYVREDNQHCAEIKVIGPSFEYHASAYADSLYKTIDLVLSKVERQINKKKDKWKKKINHKHNPSIKDKLIEGGESDEQYWYDKIEDERAS